MNDNDDHSGETAAHAPSLSSLAAPSAFAGVTGAASPPTPGGLVPVDPLPGLTAIGPVNERKARDWSLVLQSMSVWHMMRWTFRGWVLVVRDEDYDQASTSIDRYETENRDWPPQKVRERPRHAPSIVAPLLFAALALFFLVTGPVAHNSFWFQRGRAESDLVLGAEPWRALTALTLHADSSHVIGNVISGAIFASAVQRRLGPGGSALAILTAGTLGNVANAALYHAMGNDVHRSIGASTAVFGTIGLLAATQLALDRDHAAGRKRSMQEIAAPIVGGLALLGALGASPQSDLGAHFFGFVAGVVVGLGAALVLRKTRPSPRPWLQMGLFGATVALILGAWRLALPYRLVWPF
ncbi:rhomboid family intramembrane serine protease [Polyangium sp. y55x31]|uniref:rhomboid family intramembrane serine protease n=1 Tax=Polyangium sp. y55x31 TaxID=3042688 RepID=UPI002482507B|nr:rhomboid family intramembrane serine protease [Polyangium sp. y55x31]MDI1482547.1 rhomboid family intramembrane serine protease [Polyangium sp. y55x31]